MFGVALCLFFTKAKNSVLSGSIVSIWFHSQLHRLPIWSPDGRKVATCGTALCRIGFCARPKRSLSTAKLALVVHPQFLRTSFPSASQVRLPFAPLACSVRDPAPESTEGPVGGGHSARGASAESIHFPLVLCGCLLLSCKKIMTASQHKGRYWAMAPSSLNEEQSKWVTLHTTGCRRASSCAGDPNPSNPCKKISAFCESVPTQIGQKKGRPITLPNLYSPPK